MPRKSRIAVVFDTNIIVGQLLAKTRRSANARVYDLWLVKRQLQLIVSQPIVTEYLELLERIGVETENIARFHERLLNSPIVTQTNLGKRFNDSRDSDDNVMLDTAQAGRAKFLITNDRDLLEISDEAKRKFSFQIVKPSEFLNLMRK
ncbi:MAG TPA: putative toxin-antitoxin system toxin component, PIN family [Pyrinomonadaceae bacterium]|jgi:putative PIN family toxin of toxin-antitoxin system